MQGKHLTQKERFYIEKRRGEGVNQATIARELALPRSTISREPVRVKVVVAPVDSYGLFFPFRI
ncbi:helix-turn-helix domain-containing protein [Symbiopectobacterium purcellii]|uniref:helix-turn-helix domain-containing protein n=1 Tax=Symbiopectobacterium purcellii TaxID=2871826 RepID=UPI003F872BC1